MKTANHETTPNQKKARMLSLLTVLLCFAAVFIGSRMMQSQQPFPFGDLSAVSAETALAEYERSGEAEDLVAYLKVLCYRAEVAGDQSVIESIETYGSELLAMAKTESIDLEEMAEGDETLLDLLKMIRSYGAR